MSATDPVLYFVHNPKTAGTSLREVIAEHYLPEEVVRVYENESTNFFALEASGAVGNAETRVVMGHFPFGLHRLNPRPFAYTSMVRHPVERALSHYMHNRRDPRGPFHELAQGPIDRYVAEVSFVQNQQAGNLAGDFGVNGEQHGESSTSLARRAMAAIDAHYVTCGVSERFEESCRVLAQGMGWKLDHLLRLNVSPNARREIDPATRKAIEKVNQADLEVYEHVDAQLDRHLARLREAGSLAADGLPTMSSKEWKLRRFVRSVFRR